MKHSTTLVTSLVVSTLCALLSSAGRAADAVPRPTPRLDQRPAARLTEPKTFERDGQKLLYRWHAPKTIEPGRKYPLVVLFHGAGERGADNLAQLVHGADELLTYAA